MVFKPNYGFQKNERQKAKQARKEEKAREKEHRKTEGVVSDEPASTIEEAAEGAGTGETTADQPVG